MAPRVARHAIIAALALSISLAAAAAAAAPVRHGDAYTETFFDEFIHDLCGIETMTTVTERWSLKELSDGSAILHVVRTFVAEDPRIPVEKGAGAAFIQPDGSRTVVGKPLQLFEPGGGVRVLAAGRAVFDPFGTPITVRGLSPDLDDLASYYCPDPEG